MKFQKTLFITGLIVFLVPFLGFPSKVDIYIFIVLGLIVVIISLFNIIPNINSSESVFSEAEPKLKEDFVVENAKEESIITEELEQNKPDEQKQETE